MSAGEGSREASQRASCQCSPSDTRDKTTRGLSRGGGVPARGKGAGGAVLCGRRAFQSGEQDYSSTFWIPWAGSQLQRQVASDCSSRLVRSSAGTQVRPALWKPSPAHGARAAEHPRLLPLLRPPPPAPTWALRLEILLGGPFPRMVQAVPRLTSVSVSPRAHAPTAGLRKVMGYRSWALTLSRRRGLPKRCGLLEEVWPIARGRAYWKRDSPVGVAWKGLSPSLAPPLTLLPVRHARSGSLLRVPCAEVAWSRETVS